MRNTNQTTTINKEEFSGVAAKCSVSGGIRKSSSSNDMEKAISG